MNKVRQFATSPQGRKVFEEAQRVAKDPSKRQKIDEARRKLANRGGGGSGGSGGPAAR